MRNVNGTEVKNYGSHSSQDEFLSTTKKNLYTELNGIEAAEPIAITARQTDFSSAIKCEHLPFRIIK